MKDLHLISEVEEKIRKLLVVTPMTPGQVVSVLRWGYSLSTVRTAVWDMIGNHQIEMDQDLKLTLREQL